MPELPEVELAARFLRARLVGRPLAAAAVLEPERHPGLADLSRWEGRALQRVRRRGKQLALDFDDGHTLLLHLGMTGRLDPHLAGDPPAAYARFVLLAGDGEGVAFRDPRRLARIRICPTDEVGRAPEWDGLGPDALEASSDDWAAALAGRRGPVKPALLDQHRLAGIGNIYACEGLWGAGIGPERPASSLTPGEIARLRTAIREAMEDTLRRGSERPVRYLSEGRIDNPFRIYHREDQPCPRCGTPVARLTQAGRSTWYCPGCQADPPADSAPGAPHTATSRRRSQARSPRR